MPHATITDADFRRLTKAPSPGKYLFFGDEDYLKAHSAEAVRKVLCPDESLKLFNCVTIDRAGYSAAALRSALVPPPMFTACKAVSAVITFDDLKQGEVNDLLEVAALGANHGRLLDLLADDGLFEYNLLMLTVPAGGIDAGSPKRPSALLKKLAEVLVPVRFDPVSGARLREWINRHYTAAGVTVTPALCDLTSARCGESMFTLASEIDKVAYYVLADGRTEVTADDIKLVACEGGGHDAFAFANAILDRRSADALAVLSEMKARRVEPVAVMAELTRVLCDMCAVDECLEAGMPAPAICSETGLRDYPVRLYSAAVRKLPRGALAAVLAAASEADAAVKSSAQDYLPIERLICTL